MSELKIPICQFGKKLNIKQIIEKIDYVKGEKNDEGTDPNDYVVITLKEEEIID